MKIKAVIFDWAGTTIDYGCFSPLGAFIEAFKEFGLDLSINEAREHMGMLKMDHTKALLSMPQIKAQFIERYKRDYTEDDVKSLYDVFEKSVFATLGDYTQLNPFVLESVEFLRKNNIKIGTTTGYTKKMMDIILPLTAKNGYKPDCCIASDELGYGRPYPYMIYENARRLNIYPQKHIVKIGDTTIDMQEGVNAGCKNIGVVLGSSSLGLSEDEIGSLSKEKLENLKNHVKVKLYEAGADMVIDDLSHLPFALEQIDERL
ncbi:phosphonoacetaldehyde hydrolase [Helicobacter muridarum]|uniref:Phosphonoacetaldehyde hydrolase n=1 Tax=Helicobacter muridarum TaxID=216 RepID=A0A099TVR1_9HELI|nr:phosphonoacetaldehyde hydrolase [Helicobacter muridarum]TLE01674.1 phosphonoacetaldehyde hydrolase [Helicobacter muridarum]STQ86303.1 Phosphonoacetaldehyde hydrolase [Helicobacter muridarum]